MSRLSVALRAWLPGLVMLATIFVVYRYFDDVAHLFFQYGLWLLALIPSVVGLANYFIVQRPRFDAYTKDLNRDYNEFTGALETKTAPFDASRRLWGQESRDSWPQTLGTTVSAVTLAVVFGIVASIADGTSMSLGKGTPPACQDAASKAVPTKPAGSAGAGDKTAESKPAEGDKKTEAGAAAGSAAAASTATKEECLDFRRCEANRALVISGFGAWIYVVLRLLARLISTTISPKLLGACALRAGVALILGFTAGGADVFSFVNGAPKALLYFLLGLFPAWALAALRRRAQLAFQATVVGGDPLPVALIDGIDEEIAERLAEAGVSDAQHLATSNPLTLATSTLFPYLRVLDWIDQAILVGYARTKMDAFRQLGLRGSVDVAVLYDRVLDEGVLVARAPRTGGDAPLASNATTPPTPDPPPTAPPRAPGAPDAPSKTPATDLFKRVAQKADIDLSAMLELARSFYEDSQVNLIWAHWQTDPTPAFPRT